MLPPVPPDRFSVHRNEIDVTDPAAGHTKRLYRCIDVVSVSLLIGIYTFRMLLSKKANVFATLLLPPPPDGACDRHWDVPLS